MKKLFGYILILLSILTLNNCDKPAPTQLIDDTTDDFEIELLNKDPENQYYTSGADTSGITQDISRITNLISVSGIKITSGNQTHELSLAQAMFFNKTQPIKYSDGRLLAYKTIVPGSIKFNGTEAHIVPFRIKYRDNGEMKDTLLGFKYQLYNLFNGFPDPFYFDYNSTVSFEFDLLGPGGIITSIIETPLEINGNVSLNGSKINKNLEAALSWNGEGERKVTIIIGLMKPGHQQSIPIYKMRTHDDGDMKIPKRFFNELPLERFEKIVFTFIRSIENYHRKENSELLISSQSIHSIVVEIP